MSAKFNLIRTQYRLHKITASDVWAYADSGTITSAEASLICGPRPETDE